MRTTLDLDDALIAKAKTLAVKEKTTLTRLIEEALQLRMRPPVRRAGAPRRVKLPVYAGCGGLTSRVKDTRSTRALLEAADEA